MTINIFVEISYRKIKKSSLFHLSDGIDIRKIFLRKELEKPVGVPRRGTNHTKGVLRSLLTSGK